MSSQPNVYPTNADYNQSVGNLDKLARLPRLRTVQPERGPNGALVAYSGGYSRVYRVRDGGAVYALRCWTADVGDAQERYRRIGGHLSTARLPYFVGFEYLPDAITANGRVLPVLWMEWAEGPRLREYIGQHLHDRERLEALAERFLEMVSALHRENLSHGDLQDENLIIQETAGSPRLTLIDYDSFYVPALSGFPDQIIGLSNYQHPRRSALGTMSPRADHFSELVIYLALRAFAQDPRLWDPAAEKRLLFRDSDFLDLERSPAYFALSFMTAELRQLARQLLAFCREADPGVLPPLDEVVATARRAGTRAQSRRVQTRVPPDFLTPPPRPAAPAPPAVTVPDDLLRPPPRRAPTAPPVVSVPDALLQPPPPSGGPRTSVAPLPDDLGPPARAPSAGAPPRAPTPPDAGAPGPAPMRAASPVPAGPAVHTIDRMRMLQGFLLGLLLLLIVYLVLQAFASPSLLAPPAAAAEAGSTGPRRPWPV